VASYDGVVKAHSHTRARTYTHNKIKYQNWISFYDSKTSPMHLEATQHNQKKEEQLAHEYLSPTATAIGCITKNDYFLN
jgi:hypothetical protein